MNFSTLNHRELFALFANVMHEMRERGLTRTANNPVADLGESLFCDGMGWDGIEFTTRAKTLTR
jgi:hypothetical protein